MTRRTRLHLPALIVAGVLMACAVVVLALSENAEATFPGKNGGIAYSAFDFDRGPDDTIYTGNPGGGAKTQLTRGYQPSYSPNGKKIAYTLFGGADSEIYTINVGGDAMTQLTHNNNDENFPSYSPNGKRIAYTRTTYRRVTPTVSADPIDEIFTVKVGGGAKTKVTIGSDPSFSPDGKRIVYYAYDKTSSKRLPDTEIYTINVGGGHKTNSPTTTRTSSLPTIRPTAKGSSTRAWKAWSVTTPRVTSTRSKPVGEVRLKLPTTTTWTTCILPTRPTARRSPIRASFPEMPARR